MFGKGFIGLQFFPKIPNLCLNLSLMLIWMSFLVFPVLGQTGVSAKHYGSGAKVSDKRKRICKHNTAKSNWYM